jgi:hypothetical protein
MRSFVMPFLAGALLGAGLVWLARGPILHGGSGLVSVGGYPSGIKAGKEGIAGLHLLVPDEEHALRIAGAIMGATEGMGREVYDALKPFRAIRDGDVWIVRGEGRRQGRILQFRISTVNACTSVEWIQATESTTLMNVP